MKDSCSRCKQSIVTLGMGEHDCVVVAHVSKGLPCTDESSRGHDYTRMAIKEGASQCNGGVVETWQQHNLEEAVL